MAHRFAVLFSLLILNHSLLSQLNPKAVKQFQNGKEFLNKKKTDQAIKSFESAISLDPAYREAYLELYQVYSNLGNIPKAILVLARAASSVSSGKPALLYSLAQLELNNGLYADAARHFSDYLALNSKDTITRAKAELLLAKAKYSIAHLKDSFAIHFTPLTAAINTAAPEYLPSLDAPASTLVFTRRTNNQEDLYISNKHHGDWSVPQPWSKNTVKNEGAHVISADGKTIVFTGCGWEDSYGGCDLYISEYKWNKWTNPKNLGATINSRSWESQPSLSANGRTLYYVSDRPGGFGGYDVWKTTKQGAGWTRPVNAGKNINTSGDELSPCLHADGVSLYFRSDGRLGFGSQDIYLSKRTSKGLWAEPIDLGYPLNDYRDQGAMIVALDGKTAYYTLQNINPLHQLLSSDIVTFTLPPSAFANSCIYLKGQVIDANSGQTLPAIPIAIAGGANLAWKDTIYSDSEGNYLLVVPSDESYQVHVQSPGFNLYSDRIIANQGDLRADTLHHPINLLRLDRVDSLNLKPIILHNVLFELNSYNLLPESYYELDVLKDLMNANIDFNLSIQGHTDSTGNREANLVLSRQRAFAIYSYLLSKNIDPRRLSYEGYGDTRPIADNTTEAGRQKNRRVEFVLAKKVK